MTNAKTGSRTAGARLDAATVETVFERLKREMPGRREINHKGAKAQPDPFRSVVSCMLSAQSLDANTKKAADALFAEATTPRAVLDLGEARIAALIKPCGLYNAKARNLTRMCRTLIDEHGGVVPRDRAGLMSLPGIGRKCADIVMSFTFGADVIAVDTHVHRVCNRLGLTNARHADRTAEQLETGVPPWVGQEGHFWLIQFGKRVCHARRPKCETCFLNDICLAFSATP